jgi:phage terminase large subunit GpA-like protein
VTTAELSLEELVRDEFFAQLRPPPPPRRLWDFARSLRNPKGDFAGQPYEFTWHAGQTTFLLLVALAFIRDDPATLAPPPRVNPLMWRAVVALARNHYRHFALAGDTQSGKSWVMQVVLFFLLTERKWDVLYGLQDMRSASDTWNGKLAEAMKLSGLRPYLPTSGSGSGGGADIDTVRLNLAGTLYFNGAGGHRKHGGIDGRSIPAIIDDELDTLPIGVVTKNEARADAYFRSAIRFRASTVKEDDGQSNILASHDQGIQLHIEYRHLGCRSFTPLTPDQFRIGDSTSDRTAAATARIACARCGAMIDEVERQIMLRGDAVPVALGQEVTEAGDVVGEPPDASIASLMWTCFDNPWKPLGKMAVKRRLAEAQATAGRTKELDDHFHDDLVRVAPVRLREEDIDSAALASRSAAATYSRGTVPAAARFLTFAVDQQKRLLVWKVKAYDMEGRRWSVDWGNVPICAPRIEPTPEQRMEALAAVAVIAERGWPRQDSTDILRPVHSGVDVADWPDIAERFMRGRRGWVAIHGAGADMAKKLRRGSGKKVGEMHGWYVVIEYDKPRQWRVLWPESDSVKKEVSQSFARVINAPGSSMIPAGLGPHDDLVRHLTAERWQYSKDLKRHAWIKVGQYNDLWDDNYYCDTMAQWFVTENPNYRGTGAKAAPKAERDDDDDGDTPNLSWSPTLGRWA